MLQSLSLPLCVAFEWNFVPVLINRHTGTICQCSSERRMSKIVATEEEVINNLNGEEWAKETITTVEGPNYMVMITDWPASLSTSRVPFRYIWSDSREPIHIVIRYRTKSHSGHMKESKKHCL